MRAILFDFNGILVDDEPLHYELLRRVLLEEGLPLTEEEYYREYVGFDDSTAFRTALERAGRPSDPLLVVRLGARKASYYQAEIRERGYPFFPGAADLVRSAVAEGLTVGLVSGALRSEVEPALIQEGILEAFKVLVTAEDVQESKPSPDGYRQAMQALNSRPPLPARLFHPHEVLAIEDTEAGLQAATEVGLLTLGIAHTHPQAQLDRADLVAESLAGVSLGWIRDQLPR